MLCVEGLERADQTAHRGSDLDGVPVSHDELGVREGLEEGRHVVDVRRALEQPHGSTRASPLQKQMGKRRKNGK